MYETEKFKVLGQLDKWLNSRKGLFDVVGYVAVLDSAGEKAFIIVTIKYK